MRLRTYLLGVGAIVAVSSLLILVCFMVATVIGKHYGRQGCDSFARESGRETKFVSYNRWSWDCLTPTQDGKWISAYNLRAVVDAQHG